MVPVPVLGSMFPGKVGFLLKRLQVQAPHSPWKSYGKYHQLCHMSPVVILSQRVQSLLFHF